MCIEVSSSADDARGASRFARSPASPPKAESQTSRPASEERPLLGDQPRRAVPRRVVQRRRVPGPHHDEFHDRGRNRGEQRRGFAHRIEPSSGDSQREERRRHGHHAHVHRHVRAEGLPRQLRQRPEPDGGEREQSEQIRRARRISDSSR